MKHIFSKNFRIDTVKKNDNLSSILYNYFYHGYNWFVHRIAWLYPLYDHRANRQIGDYYSTWFVNDKGVVVHIVESRYTDGTHENLLKISVWDRLIEEDGTRIASTEIDDDVTVINTVGQLEKLIEELGN